VSSYQACQRRDSAPAIGAQRKGKTGGAIAPRVLPARKIKFACAIAMTYVGLTRARHEVHITFSDLSDVVVMIGMDQGRMPSWAAKTPEIKGEPRRFYEYVG